MKLTKSQLVRFRDAVGQLNLLLREVRVGIPEANYYLANDTIHLMSGPSHDDTCGQRARHDRSMTSDTLYFSGGGDW